MKKLSKFILSLSIIPIFGITISCGTQTQEQSKELVFNQTNPFKFSPYFLDYSNILETNIKSNNLINTLGSADLFRLKTIKSPEYDHNGKLISSGVFIYKMELAKSIIIKTKNKELIFDNDRFEIEKINKDIYVQANSQDQKSINSKTFRNLLKSKDILEFSVQIKDNVFWTNTKGEKTKYKIKAKDFWFSFLRSYYSGTFQRKMRGHTGTVQETTILDNNLKARIHDNSNGRFKSVLFTNTQQFEINGLSSGKFLDFDNKTFQPINAIRNNSLIFQVDPDYINSLNAFNFFDLMLVRSQIFSAAPSDYIIDLAKKDLLNPQLISYQDSKNIKHKINQNGKGIIHQIGLYFYGVNGWKNNLYAGPYYPDQKSSSKNTMIFKLNSNYWDQDFVNSQTTIQRIKINANSKDNEIEFNNFKNNQNIILDSNNLNESQKTYFSKQKLKIKLIPYKKYIKNISVGNNAFNITPQPAFYFGNKIQKTDFSNFAFNDVYSKLVYGASIQEINNGFIGKNYDNNRRSIGYGVFKTQSVAFRNLINASINWEYLKDSLSKTNQLWMTNAAPDALIGGKDQATSTYKTLRDGSKIINDIPIIDGDGNLIEKKKNLKYLVSLKSLYYDSVKQEVSKLLDRFYNDSYNKVQPNQKVEWFVYNNRILSTNEKKNLRLIIDNINQLDKRLNVKLVIKETQEEINEIYGDANGTGNSSIAQYLKYSYEYNSLSPYLDKMTHAIGHSPFALWHKFSMLSPTSNLALNFPELYKFSTALKEKVEAQWIKYNELLQYDAKTYKQTFTKIIWNDLIKFNSYEERGLYLRGKLHRDDHHNFGYSFAGFGGVGYLWDGSKSNFIIDNITEQSRFAIWYVENHTNEELVNLIKELNVWRSFNIDLDKNIKSLDNISYKITHNNLEFPIAINDVVYVQDIKFK